MHWYWIWTILSIIWYVVWIVDLVANGNNNHGTLACGLSSFALSEIHGMKDGK